MDSRLDESCVGSLVAVLIGHFEVARETGSRALLNCIVGLFWGTYFHHCVRGARTQVARKPYTRS